MLNKPLLLFAIIALFAATATAQDLPQIAVYVTGDLPDGNKRVFGARLLTAITGTWRYSGIERPGEFFAEAERKRTEEYGGTINDAQISELGRQYGIGYVCVANLTLVDGTYKINTRIVDIKNAETVLTGKAASPLQTADELAAVLKTMVEEMFSGQAEPSKKDSPATTETAAPAAPAAAQDLPPIAVYVTGDVPENEKKAFGTIMLATLVNSGKYKGIERNESFLAEVDKEHIKQRSGAIDDSQISELGKQAGAKFICIADITKAFRTYQVSARIVDVETAEVPFIGETSSPLHTLDDLKDASDKVVESMFGGGIVPRRKKTGMSIGVGGLLSTDFGGGITWNTSAGKIAMPYYGGGAYLFLDYKYVQVSAAFSTGAGKWDSPNVPPDSLFDMSRTSVSIGVYGKYPFALGEFGNVRLYPLLGADYELSIAGQLMRSNGSKYVFGSGDKRHEQASDLSALWVKLGCGADFDVSDAIYLRGELLYGARTANKLEKDGVDRSKEEYTAETRLGHGLMFRVGAGMKF